MSLLELSDSSLCKICKFLNVNPLILDKVRITNKKFNEIVVSLGLDMVENVALSISCDPADIINSWPFENDKANRDYIIKWDITLSNQYIFKGTLAVRLANPHSHLIHYFRKMMKRVRSLLKVELSFWRICDRCLEQLCVFQNQLRSVVRLHIGHCQLSVNKYNFANFLSSMNLKELYLGYTAYNFVLDHSMFQQLKSISISLEQTNNLVFNDSLLDLWCKSKPTKVDIWKGMTNFTLPKLWECIKIILFDDSSRTPWSEPFSFATLKITQSELSDFLRNLQNTRGIECAMTPFSRMRNIISVQTCLSQYPNRVVTFYYHRPQQIQNI